MTHRPRPRRLLVALAVLAAVAATACDPAPAPAPTPAPYPRTIDVNGDSLTVTAVLSVGWAGAPIPQCAPGYQPSHGCHTADRTVGVGWTLDHLDETERTRIAAGRPSTLIVALGNNDAATGWPGQDGWSNADRARWAALFNATHPDTCIVAVLPGTGAGEPLTAAYRAELAEMRAAVPQLAAARPGPEVIVDWQAEIDRARAAGIDLTAPDGVHLPDEVPTRMVAGTRAVDAEAARWRLDAMWQGAAACP